MKFAKAHGTGNDFVVLADPDGEIDLRPDLVVALCDRRHGIGGDGVLRVVRSAKHPDATGMATEAEWFMDYRNSDGSLAEMCGNGVRVFARFLTESGLATGPKLSIATRAGVVGVDVTPELITAYMPVPRVERRGHVNVSGVTFSGPSVSAGNPNLVITLQDRSQLAALDLATQPQLPPDIFPRGANVEFIVPAGSPTRVPAGPPTDSAADADEHVIMRVYERGSGETQSCGSGACAVAAAVLSAAGLRTGTVLIDVPGGSLRIAIDADSCRLTGPAVIVATGDVDLAALRR